MKTKMMALWMVMVVLMGTVCAGALADDHKTLTVGADEGYKTIQAAIDHIAEQPEEDRTGWTIRIMNGEYDRFTVPHYSSCKIADLKMIGESAEGVIVHALTDEDRGALDNGGINIYGKNVTLQNMTIKAGASRKSWSDAAISTHHGAIGGAEISLSVDNCTLVGPGIDKGATYGIFWACSKMNVTNCTISGFANAIEFMNDGFRVPAGETFYFTDNTIIGSSFAIHGYMGGGNGGGTLLIADNTIAGTDSLRSKVIVQDNAANSLVADIKNNTLTNALIGTVNLQDRGDIVSDVLKSNTFGENCFYVDAIEPGTIEVYATYTAPEQGYGRWIINDESDLVGSDNPAGALEFVKQAIAAANATGSHTLSITGIDADHLIRTFTWFKDMIYWETGNAPVLPAMPVTGDNSRLALFAVLLALSVAGLMVCRRRSER